MLQFLRLLHQLGNYRNLHTILINSSFINTSPNAPVRAILRTMALRQSNQPRSPWQHHRDRSLARLHTIRMRHLPTSTFLTVLKRLSRRLHPHSPRTGTRPSNHLHPRPKKHNLIHTIPPTVSTKPLRVYAHILPIHETLRLHEQSPTVTAMASLQMACPALGPKAAKSFHKNTIRAPRHHRPAKRSMRNVSCHRSPLSPQARTTIIRLARAPNRFRSRSCSKKDRRNFQKNCRIIRRF